jgi:hypothetical protein
MIRKNQATECMAYYKISHKAPIPFNDGNVVAAVADSTLCWSAVRIPSETVCCSLIVTEIFTHWNRKCLPTDRHGGMY